jgi:hypothetical protein
VAPAALIVDVSHSPKSRREPIDLSARQPSAGCLSGCAQKCVAGTRLWPLWATTARSIPTGSLANAERWFEEPGQGAESTLESGADRNYPSEAMPSAFACQTAFSGVSTPVRLRSKACRWHPFVALVGQCCAFDSHRGNRLSATMDGGGGGN